MVNKNLIYIKLFTNNEILTTQLNILNVNQIITYRTLFFIFKIVKGLAPSYLTEIIVFNKNCIQ